MMWVLEMVLWVEFGDGTGQDWGRGRGVTRVRSYLHTLAELANLAMDHIALLLRYVGFLEHARRFGDRFLCGYKCIFISMRNTIIYFDLTNSLQVRN